LKKNVAEMEVKMEKEDLDRKFLMEDMDSYIKDLN